MIAKYLWEFGSLIILTLGSLHLFFTFFSDKFSSRNQNVVDEMKSSYPKLTKETTIWRAWVGFNASHSSGAMFIGAINLYIAIAYFPVFQSDHFFFLFNIITVGFYVWLARRYWFKIPFVGTLLTLICYTLSYILIFM